MTPNGPRAYQRAGVVALASETHDAEEAGDDLTFLAIQDEIERRRPAEREAYRLAWIEEGRRRYLARKA